MRLAIVDFPEPDGPTSAVISPARAVKLIWCKASVRVAFRFVFVGETDCR